MTYIMAEKGGRMLADHDLSTLASKMSSPGWKQFSEQFLKRSLTETDRACKKGDVYQAALEMLQLWRDTEPNASVVALVLLLDEASKLGYVAKAAYEHLTITDVADRIIVTDEPLCKKYRHSEELNKTSGFVSTVFETEKEVAENIAANEQKIADLQKQNKALREEKEEMKAKYDSANASLNKIQLENKALIEEKDEMKAKYNSANASLNKIQSENKALFEKKDAVQAKCDSANASLNRIQSENKALVDEKNTIREKYDKAHACLNRIQTEVTNINKDDGVPAQLVKNENLLYDDNSNDDYHDDDDDDDHYFGDDVYDDF